MTTIGRRQWLLGSASLGLASAVGLEASDASAFGEQGAFHARVLQVGAGEDLAATRSAAGRWAFEVVERTSAPGRLSAEVVQVESSALLREPFVVWAGTRDPGPLSTAAIRRLREYLHLGGVVFVDDRAPASGVFRAAVKREMARVLPEGAPVPLGAGHVLFKSYYILDRPHGRVEGPSTIQAIVRGKNAQVIFFEHDLLGALERRGQNWAHEVQPGGSRQRELALRMAVNVAMYVLCSDYKDDQVHAPFLMRRRLRK